MGRNKTTAGRIRECLSGIAYWDQNKGSHGEVESRAMFLKALKNHLAHAEEYGKAIPADVKRRALNAIG